MALTLERPLVFLDLEATGVDTVRDRIVQIACIRLEPDGSRRTLESLVNPQMPIPPEASAVHHITDTMVAAAPAFKDLASRLTEFLAGADLGGFGICRFDVPMLVAEYKRAQLALDMTGRRTVDALLIFHKMEPRNLSAALRFYCGKELEGAHDALADAQASLEVFEAQLTRYRGRTPPQASLPGDLQGIHDFCCATDPKNVDARGKFVWRHGAATFNFGKHQSKTLEEVARTDRSYIEWLSRAEGSTPDVIAICRQALAGVFPKAAEKRPPA